MINIGRRWVPEWLYNAMPRVTVVIGMGGVYSPINEAGLMLSAILVVYGASIIFLRGRL